MLAATKVCAAALAVMFVASACQAANSETVDTLESGVIPFSEPDLVNPLRGQYENLATPLFPQSRPAQRKYMSWPETTDISVRIDWRTLQPRDPRTLPPRAPDHHRYDFRVLDRAIASAATSGRRVGFRVTAFNSCCESHAPGATDIAVPDWLRSIPGATRTHRHAGINYVIPEWNNSAYLSHFRDLLAALGRRYDRDERVAVVEMSGYGDFSENHVAFMRDTLGIPGPTPEQSIQQLGYFSQYRDQYITKDSINLLVEANLAAFPNTQMIAAAGNPEITRQLFVDHPQLKGRRKPVGIRADGLGAYRPIPTWAYHQDSRYVQRRDPLVDVVASRFRTAPIITEWIPNPPATAAKDYYLTGLRDVVNDHVSMTSSTGFPAQLTDTPMPEDEFQIWSKANKFSGYRYAVAAEDVAESVPPASSFRLTFKWTNFGSAPTYEQWQVEYDIVSSDDQTVRTLPATIDLRRLVADQQFHDATATPKEQTVTDTVAVENGLPAGHYTVRARVMWHEHKPSASNVVEFPPMHLGQYGRDSRGAYPIAKFTVR